MSGYDCVCDYDPPEFFSCYQPRARKQHRCYECGGEIRIGEQYEYAAGKWDGYVDTFKTCERCFDIRQWVTNNVPCYCWAYGEAISHAREACEEAACRAPEETRGLRFGLLRRIVERDRLNSARREERKP